MNVTPPAAVNPTVSSFLTIFPNSPRPVASDLNLVPGDLKGNLSIAAICVNGSISIYNNAGTVDVVIETPLLVRPTPGEVERAPQGQRGMYAAGGETSQSVTTSVRRPPGSAPENLIFTLVKYLRPAALTVWERKN